MDAKAALFKKWLVDSLRVPRALSEELAQMGGAMQSSAGSAAQNVAEVAAHHCVICRDLGQKPRLKWRFAAPGFSY